MSKADLLLRALQKNIGKWTCAICACYSGQPAATFRELKKAGYQFRSVAKNRWAKELFCPICKDKRTHYKLLSMNPVFVEKKRINISKPDRDKIIALLDGKDAFTGATISSTPEIDHKMPWTRMDQDVNAGQLSDQELMDHFQLLTREHNLLKDRKCMECKKTLLRPPFLEIPFWYVGDAHYSTKFGCKGCGWYDAETWRAELSKIIYTDFNQKKNYGK